RRFAQENPRYGRSRNNYALLPRFITPHWLIEQFALRQERGSASVHRPGSGPGLANTGLRSRRAEAPSGSPPNRERVRAVQFSPISDQALLSGGFPAQNVVTHNPANSSLTFGSLPFSRTLRPCGFCEHLYYSVELAAVRAARQLHQDRTAANAGGT